MCTGFDQIPSGVHPSIARATAKIHKLKSEVIWAISVVFTVAHLLGSFTWTDNVKILALDYTFTSTASNILKAYVRFTGTQLLIINKNQFNWTNVRIEIHSEISPDRHPHDTIAPGTFTLMLSVINTGEVYSVRVTQFRREDGTELEPLTTGPENIKIWSDTPHGRGFWHGGFVQPLAVADQPLPPEGLRSQP
jgi:hypothetical protein